MERFIFYRKNIPERANKVHLMKPHDTHNTCPVSIIIILHTYKMHYSCTEEKNSTKVKVSKQIYSQELHKNEGRLLRVWIFSDFHFYVIPENLKVQSLCLVDREFDLVNRYDIAYFSRFRTRTISNLHIYSTKKTQQA